MNCSMPGFPVLHYFPEFAQTYVHWISDAIQPFHPLSFPFSSSLQSFPASGSFQMSQFFASGGQSIRASALASIFPMNVQGWFPLRLTGLISLLSKDSPESSPAPQFESISSSALSLLYGPTLTSLHDYWSIQLWLDGPLLAKWNVCFLKLCIGLSELLFKGASVF